MKIAVLVKEVPDAAVEKRIDASTGRMDRSGEKNLNPFDTHAIEAAMQLKEGDDVPVRIDVVRGELHMHASSPGQGMVATSIPVDGELPYASGFTLSHIRDVLTRCSGEKVTIGFSAEPNRPIRVVEGSVTHITNPNRKAVEMNRVDL